MPAEPECVNLLLRAESAPFDITLELRVARCLRYIGHLGFECINWKIEPHLKMVRLIIRSNRANELPIEQRLKRILKRLGRNYFFACVECRIISAKEI